MIEMEISVGKQKDVHDNKKMLKDNIYLRNARDEKKKLYKDEMHLKFLNSTS